MGKAPRVKTSRKLRKTLDPLARKEKPKAEPDAQATTIAPLVAKLNSGNPEDRATALGTISALVENEQLRMMFLKEKLVVRLLGTSLKDSDLQVVANGYGLLRNLVIEQGYDLAKYVFRQNVLDTVSAEAQKWTQVIQSGSEFDQMTVQQKQAGLETLQNILGLVCAMAGFDDEIFDAVAGKLQVSELLPFIIDFCKAHINDTAQLYCVAIEALYTLSEGNPELAEVLEKYGVDQLLDAQFPAETHVYIIGVMYNIFIEKSIKDKSKDNSISLQLLQKLVSVVRSIDSASAIKKLEEDKFEFHARFSVNAVQTALEIFTAVSETVSVDPSLIYKAAVTGAENSESMEEDLNDEQMAEKFLEQQEAARKAALEEGQEEPEEDNDMYDEDSYDESKQDPAITYMQDEVLPFIVSYLSSPVFSTRAFIALNNIVWTLEENLPPIAPKWKANAAELWNNILPIACGDLGDIEGQNGAVGILYAIAQAFRGDTPITIDQIRPIVQLYVKFRDNKDVDRDAVAEYGSRTVGLLTHIAMRAGRHDITKEVADFLLTIITQPAESHPIVIIETLNALFDIFGDAIYDYDEPVFVKGGMLNILQQSFSKVRTVLKKVDKNKLPALREEADEALVNLSRFIDYKKKERRH